MRYIIIRISDEDHWISVLVARPSVSQGAASSWERRGGLEWCRHPTAFFVARASCTPSVMLTDGAVSMLTTRAVRTNWQRIRDRHHPRSAADNLFTHSKSSPWTQLVCQFEELIRLDVTEWTIEAEGDDARRALLSAHHPLGVLHANVLTVFEASMQAVEQREWAEEAKSALAVLKD